MAKKTSVHLIACNIASCEKHCLRKIFLDYIFPKLSKNNEYYNFTGSKSLEKDLADIKKRVKEKTGREMYKNAVPIKEGVVVIDEKTTMDDLKKFCNEIKSELGLVPLRIYIHRDEGWRGSADEEPKLNLHAHVVWSMYDENGRNVRFKKAECRIMQDIAAEILGMQRGEASGKTHLDAVQFKIKKETERLNDTYSKIERLQRARGGLNTMISNLLNEKEALETEIIASRAASGKDLQDLQEKLDFINAKIQEKQEKLSDVLSRIDQAEFRNVIIAEKTKKLSAELAGTQEEIQKKQDEFIKYDTIAASASRRAETAAESLLKGVLFDFFVREVQKLPENDREKLGYLPFFADNNVMKTALHLFLGQLADAKAVAEGAGGGAASPGEGWDGDKDKDARRFAARCAEVAAAMCLPRKNGRGRRR